jgi:hypothetical protein
MTFTLDDALWLWIHTIRLVYDNRLCGALFDLANEVFPSDFREVELRRLKRADFVACYAGAYDAGMHRGKVTVAHLVAVEAIKVARILGQADDNPADGMDPP